MPPGPPKIYGAVTLNDKCQVVIPVDARTSIGIGPGSKLLVMGPPHFDALMLVKVEDVEAKIKDFTTAIAQANQEDLASHAK